MDPKVARLTAIGEALHGERWQRPLARQLGVSTALMSSIATGVRRVTLEFEDRLLEFVTLEIPRREATLAALHGYVDAIEGEMLARARRSKPATEEAS